MLRKRVKDLLQLTIVLRHDTKDLRIFIKDEVASLEDDDRLRYKRLEHVLFLF